MNWEKKGGRCMALSEKKAGPEYTGPAPKKEKISKTLAC